MALPASGYLQLGTDGATGRSVNSEFGYGNDMASYRGAYYATSGGALAQFPVIGNSLAMNVFYSTAKIAPGSATLTANQNYVIPVYNTITITTHGDQGGQSGYYGTNACGTPVPTPSGGGSSSGVVTNFGGYVSSSAGAGGTGSGGLGSYGAVNAQTFTNPVKGGSGPTSGTTIVVTVAPGGAGGVGGPNFVIASGFCTYLNSAPNGSAGAAGYITLSWS